MSVRVGFVGAGGVSNAHMNLLESMQDVQIVSIADNDPERAEAAALLHVAKPYTDALDMLENENLDAVYFCTPPFAHGEAEIFAAQKGIHIFVEKPVAIDMKSANRMLDTITRSGVVNAVGYHWRYQSISDRAKHIINGRDVGMMQGYWMSGAPSIKWWGRMDQSGGQIVEQATHIFDLARYLCGEISEVYAVCSVRALKDLPDFDIYDVSAVTVKFESGAVGTVASTCMLGLPYTVGLHLILKDTVLEIHGDLKVIEPGHTEVFTMYENPMLALNRSFIDAVITGDRSGIRSTYADAVKTLEVTLACNASAATGMPVKITN